MLLARVFLRQDCDVGAWCKRVSEPVLQRHAYDSYIYSDGRRHARVTESARPRKKVTILEGVTGRSKNLIHRRVFVNMMGQTLLYTI